MALVKSKIIDHLSDNYPNFLKKDLSKLIEITLSKIENALEKNERVELRDILMFEAKKYKSKHARNPKTNEIILVPKRKIIRLKISKKWSKKINEEI